METFQAPARYLLIEDNDDHARLLDQLLRTVPFQVASIARAVLGVEGCNLAAEADFDCIFLDFELPDLSGIEVLARILSEKPSASVVMVTARGSEELAVEAMKRGAVDYLVKGNLTSKSLERSLLGLFERRRLEGKVREAESKLVIAERQRAMLASVGAACHHFSQPVSTLMGRLELLLLKEPDFTEQQAETLKDCLRVTRRMQELLSQFRRVEEFRTTPYLDGVDILDIDPDAARGGSADGPRGV